MDLDSYGPVPVSDYDYVVCSNCGAEFQPHIAKCIDCGAATVPPGAAREREREPEEEEEEERPLSQNPELVLLTGDSFANVEELREALEEEGLPSWIEPSGPRGNSFRVYVRRRDYRRAGEIDREVLRGRLPEGERELAEIPRPGICPFCKTRLPKEATECPGCGLVLAEFAPPPAGSLGVVKSLYEALAAQDEVRILDLLHPDIEWIQNEGFPGGGRRLGAKTVLTEVFGRLARDWEGWGADVQEWLDVPAEGTVIALGVYHGTCRRTRRSMRAVFAHVYRVQDGRIYRFEQYADTAKIVEACAED
ncbi:MAG: nuclear transport factor 2 family protein [Thermoanaerobaculia bacterium]